MSRWKDTLEEEVSFCDTLIAGDGQQGSVRGHYVSMGTAIIHQTYNPQ
jgi:hypothetical protein